MIRTRKIRRGVTLVEMIVATAMCILGMWMLTWMFQQATASFSLANAQVSLTGQERMVTQIMTKDLEADKFLDDDTRQNRGRKLADLRSDLLNSGGYVPPRSGYFLAQSRPPDNLLNFIEPNDSNGFGSSRSADHFLQFTAILPDTPGNRYYAEVQTQNGRKVVAGVAAEISYFLVRSGQTASGVPLYDLMRVQRVAAQSPYDAADFDRIAVQPGLAATPPDAVDEVLTVFNNRMQTLNDLTIPTGFNGSPRFANRVARPTSSRRYGEDRMMANVLSFEVKFTGVGALGTNWPAPFPGNSDHPYDTLPYDGKFDTFSTRIADWATNPTYRASATNQGGQMKPIRITGAMIRIRALSGTTARQTTIVVSL